MSKQNTPHDVLALYQEVEKLTGSMLSAAHRADWDKLVELEAGCADCIESLKGCNVPAQLSEEARREKIELLKRILSNDREIRQLTEPWMKSLGKLLESANARCQVAKTYRSE